MNFIVVKTIFYSFAALIRKTFGFTTRRHYQKYGIRWLKLCKLQFNIATKSDYKIYEGIKITNFHLLCVIFSQFRCEQFRFHSFMYEQYFYTNIGRILYVQVVHKMNGCFS